MFGYVVSESQKLYEVILERKGSNTQNISRCPYPKVFSRLLDLMTGPAESNVTVQNTCRIIHELSD